MSDVIAPAAQQIVCVLGMHRSGTSLLTGILDLIGFSTGPDSHLMVANEFNPKGFWEHQQITDLNDEILRRLGGRWDQPPVFPIHWEYAANFADLRQQARSIVREDFGALQSWCWKDPRSCLTLPFWRTLLPRMTYLVCLRSPADVAHSLARRDGFPSQKSSALWLAYTRAALVNSAGEKRLLLFYDDMLDGRGLAAVADFLGASERANDPRTRRAVEEFLDDHLRHHKGSLIDTVDEPGLSYPAKAFFAALRAWSETYRGTGGDRQEFESAITHLAECANQAEIDSEAIGQQLVAAGETNNVLAERVRALDGQIRDSEARLIAKASECANIGAEREALDRQLQQATATLAQVEAAHTQLGAEHQNLRRNFAQTASNLGQKEAEIEAWRARIDGLQLRIDNLTADLRVMTERATLSGSALDGAHEAVKAKDRQIADLHTGQSALREQIDQTRAFAALKEAELHQLRTAHTRATAELSQQQLLVQRHRMALDMVYGSLAWLATRQFRSIKDRYLAPGTLRRNWYDAALAATKDRLRRGRNPAPVVDLDNARLAAVDVVHTYELDRNQQPSVWSSTLASSLSVSSHGPDPRVNHFNVYANSQGNFFFTEIRDLIAAGLRQLGFTVGVKDERDGFAAAADWHVVVAPHEFFVVGAGESLGRGTLPANLIVFNTEQPSTQWYNVAQSYFAKAARIWDLNQASVEALAGQGYRCDFLRLGYMADFGPLNEIAELPQSYGTASLGPDVSQGSYLHRPFIERPIDVLFLGTRSTRREEFLARNAALLSRYRCYLYVPEASAPLVAGMTTHLDSRASAGLSQRSKIVLNLHRGEDRYFEWHRIVMHGIWQRALVISETCGGAPPFVSGIDYVESPLDEMPQRIQHFLSSAEGQREAQKIIDHGFATLVERCSLVDMLVPLVQSLGMMSAHGILPQPKPTPAGQSGLEPSPWDRFRYSYDLLPAISIAEIRERKIALVAGYGQADSIRDYGGLWGVFGLYLLQGAKALGCKSAEMIDVTPRAEFAAAISELQAQMAIEVTMTQADFRNPDIYKALDAKSVSLLFEVVLHQDNAEEVIKNVLAKTTSCVCFAQPVLKEEVFQLPNGCVNLQFFPEDLKDALRIPDWWPKEPPVERFTTRYWMWGQTASYIQSIFHGHGWRLDFIEAYDLTENWNYALMRFVPRQDKSAVGA